MPPVRWKVLILHVIFIIQICYSQSQRLSEPMSSITADGWRPIIGSSTNNNNQYVQYPVEESTGRPVSSSAQPPIQRYPSSLGQHSQYASATTSPSTMTPNLSTPYNNKPIKVQSTHYGLKNKLPLGSKFNPTSNQVFMMSSHGKPHVIPLGSRGVSSITPPSIYRNSPISKMPPHIGQKRKPIRVQQAAHSQKDEIFAQAPSSAIGTYTFYNQAVPPSHRIRDNAGLGSTKYHIQQPHGHIEFTNHFGLKTAASSDDIIQPQTLREISNSQFLFQNPNDEFSLNLVPPPLAKPFQEKPKEIKNLLKIKPAPLGEPIASDPNLLIEKQNLVLSGLPSTYQSHSISSPLNKGEQLVDFQITKEKFNVFHNNIPPNYEPQKFPQFENVKSGIETHKFPQFENLAVKPLENSHAKTHQYEVTEGKQWLEPALPFQPHFASVPISVPTRESITEVRQQHRTRRPQKQQEYQSKPFLPTPLGPNGANPTIPTQSEASSIYNLVSNKNNLRATLNPQFFNIKDVSTHYPIIGEIKTTVDPSTEPDYSNEVIDKGAIRTDFHFTATPTQPTETTTKNNSEYQRNRLNQRRRRPGLRQRTTTTETPTENQNEDYASGEREDVEIVQTEKRQKQRPVSRYRTTETPPSSTTATNNRIRQRPSEEKRNKPNRLRARPTQEIKEEAHMPSNHKMSAPGEMTSARPTKQSFTTGQYESEDSMELNRVPSSPKTYTTTFDVPASSNNFYKQSDSSEEDAEMGTGHIMQPYDREHSKIAKGQRTRLREQEVRPSINYEYVDSAEEEKYTRKRNKYEEADIPFRVPSTAEPYPTDRLPTTILHTPENEIDYTTLLPERQSPTAAITIQEITKKEMETSTLPSSTTPTAETSTTSKLNRIRQRPNKYESQQRPRFSVKDYRQRLQQATTTTTESSSRASTDSPRLRFPIRMRTTTTTHSPVRTEENAESATDLPSNSKNKFMPKDPRFRGGTTESPNESNTEKTFKPVNPRLRPFGRNRASTESPSGTTTSTTQRVSIKPNIFSNLRKPPALSLRTRIQNRNKALNKTEETTTTKPIVAESTEPEPSDVPETTIFNDIKMDAVTEAVETKMHDVDATTEAHVESNSESATPDILKSESFLYSQRVSDLTSSARKEYDTPGLFKSVSPNSRRVPNYFTIATDDPRLPIEAFFPNLNNNGKE